MRMIPLENVPGSLFGAILRKSARDCATFENLKKGYAEATRTGNHVASDKIGSEIAKCMAPEHPAISIVGGQGGYVLVDEEQLSLPSVGFESLS
jgi:hypothetical protein